MKFLQKEPFYQVEIKTFPDVPVSVNLETEALMRNVKEQIERLVSFGKVILPDIMVVIENVDDPDEKERIRKMGPKEFAAMAAAVNDDEDSRNDRAYESLVRRILLSPNEPALMLLMMCARPFCVSNDMLRSLTLNKVFLFSTFTI